MAFIVDEFHKKQLDKHKINIKTTYISADKILERNTDGKKNDDVKNGIRARKDYYIDGSLVHIETKFDSRITYTYISEDLLNNNFKCVNCGMSSNLNTFIDGCPYCGTNYNLEYTDKDLGSKYHYDLVLKSNLYRIITYFVDLIISIILSFVYIKTTSRTFNSYDISKVFIFGFILSLVLYYAFYLMDAYIILGPIKNYKDRINKEQENFWTSSNIDKKTFFNNLNYEIRKKYYSNENIIDYDILDYDKFTNYEKNNKIHVKVKVYLRVIYLINGKIKSKYIKDEFILVRHNEEVENISKGTNMLRCHNCGSTLNVNDKVCSYCGTKIKYYQEWMLEK